MREEPPVEETVHTDARKELASVEKNQDDNSSLNCEVSVNDGSGCL